MIFVWFGNISSSNGKVIFFLGTWVCRNWCWSSEMGCDLVMGVHKAIVRMYVFLTRPLKGKFEDNQIVSQF